MTNTGTTIAAMTPITVAYSHAPDVAGRPYWQDRPCPPWCKTVIPHQDSDQLDSRYHMSPVYDITLTLEAAHIDRFPAENCSVALEVSPGFITADLHQDWREREPRVFLVHDGTHDIELTVAEARELAEALSSLIQQADDAAEDRTS
jgi:hypothetical protein